MKQDMIEHVAKRLCKASLAITPDYPYDQIQCPICYENPEKCIWQSFVPEAEAAINAVRDFAMLSMRKKPKIG